MTKDEALKLALEALENSVDLVVEDAYNAEQLYGNMPTRQGKVNGLKVLADEHQKAITAIKQALAQLEQDDGMCTACENNLCTAKQGCVALDNPPQRTWVGLTDEEIDYIYTGIRAIHHDVDSDVLCRAIEAKLKEKNT